jgi:transposase
VTALVRGTVMVGAEEAGVRVLADVKWAELEPLIEECRPRSKTDHRNLRRTIEAIVWRHRNGAAWRSIPAELGPWWAAAQRHGFR